ncbi:MAG: hypothetical protein WBX26_10780, partial [Candidatus Cybelea sp.]
MRDLSNLQGKPNFNLLDPKTFESLCTDIIRLLPGVRSVHKNTAKSQQGIDAFATYEDQRVGAFEFKRYEKDAFDGGMLRRTCDRFAADLETWKGLGVSEFCIVLSEDLPGSATPEVLVQHKRFSGLGVNFDVWTGSALYAKAVHVGASDVFQRYFPDPLWRQTQPSASRSTALYVDALLVDRIESLAGSLSKAVRDRLLAVRVKLRAGHVDEVREAISEVHALRGELPASDVADWLRLEARLYLRARDLDNARLLADEAQHLDADSEGNLRLSALIELYESDNVRKALGLLAMASGQDSLQLKAALLLAEGSVDEAKRIIEGLSDDRDPETLRLHAALAIAAADLPTAKEHLERGLEVEPENEGLQHLRGIVLYYQALVKPPRYVPDMPDPADWVTVRTDANARSALSEAARQFERLAKIQTTDEKQHAIYALWHMAALANQADRQEEALELARAAIGSAGTAVVLGWAIARRWEIDPASYADGVIQSFDAAELERDPRPLWLIIDVLLYAGRATEAQRVLHDYRNIFDVVGALDLWRSYLARTLLALGDNAAALTAVDETDEDFVLARLAVRRKLAIDGGDPTSLIEYVRALSPMDPLELLECCDAMASFGEWSYVSDRAETLLNSVPNLTALHLASAALYNTGEMGRCAAITESASSSGIATSDFVTRISALAHMQLGNLRLAVTQARTLAEKSPSVQNMLTLADLEWRLGNRLAVVNIAKKLRSHSGLAAEERLRLAAWVQRDDRDLARSLWREALESLPDALVPAALTLAYRLELENETEPLIQRFVQLGSDKQHGVRMVDVDELKDLLRRQRDYVLNALQLYNKGAIWAHFYADARNLPLSLIYSTQFAAAANAPNLAATAPTYLVSGARARYHVKDMPKRLRVDLSALLTAAHFDFLTRVEESFDEMILPYNAISVLENMRQETEPAQPARIRVVRAIVDRVADGRIKTVPSLPTGARRVIFGPSEDSEALQWFDILRAIEKAGVAVERLSDWRELLTNVSSGSPKDVALPVGARIVFEAGVLEVAPETELVDVVSRFFDVSLDEKSYQHDVLQVNEASERTRHAEWLGRLIEHVSNMAEQTDLYSFAQRPKAAAEDLDAASKGFISLLERSERDEGIWIDDRFANTWTSANEGTPVLTCVDILEALRRSNRLSQSEHYSYLRTLRDSNVRWIPVQADEVSYYIEHSISADGFEPNAELLALRRYIASATLGFRDLQRPNAGPQGATFGEYEFALDLRNAVNSAIFNLWSAPPRSYCEVAAAWLYRNLVFDVFPAFLFPEISARQVDFQHVFAASVAAFVVHSFSRVGAEGGRQEMNAWYDQMVLEPRNGLDPGVIELAAQTVDGVVTSSLPPEIDNASRISVARFIEDLPATLKGALSPQSGMLAIVGGKRVGQVHGVGDVFDIRGLLEGVKAAIDHGQAEINSAVDAKRTYKIMTNTN